MEPFPIRRHPLRHGAPLLSATALLGATALIGATVLIGTAAPAQAGGHQDTTPPSAPTVTSTAYPAPGPTTVTAGGSGTIAMSSTDSGAHATGVASFTWDLDGTSISTGGLTGSLPAYRGHATLTVALASLHWGTNVLRVQAVDGAGNTSPVTDYAFFVQQSAFGSPTPGLAGDLTGDGRPDLLTVTENGDVQLYPGPDTGTVDPTGDTTADPHQVGGQVLIPANHNARWAPPDSASAAGALVTHAGSFTGTDRDDVLAVQNGHLTYAANTGDPGPWVFTSDLTRPGCASCAHYNSTDWSSVTQLAAAGSTTAAMPPHLLTVEVVDDVATLWLFPAVPNVPAFAAPTALSVSTPSWHWDDLQLVGAGTLPGSTGIAAWVRDPDTGTLYLLHNVDAGVADPAAAAVVVATGLTAAAYPLLTTPGVADAQGNLPLWATDATGHLVVIPTTTTGGLTTVSPPFTVSAAGWASHQLALGAGYRGYDNRGVATDGQPGGVFDQTTTNTFAYSAEALATATLAPDALLNDGSGGCPVGWTTCVAGLGSTTLVALPNDLATFDSFTLPAPWAGRRDNTTAAGQLLAVPTPGSDGPAHAIRFLGAAATTDAVNGVSVPVTLTYTDGSTQTVTVTFADWTQDVRSAPMAGTTVVATMDHRTVAATGASDPTTTYLFATPDIALLPGGAPVPAGVQIASVRLGTNPAVHVFAVAVD